MKTIKFSGVIENAYGKPVSPALKFSGHYKAYEKGDTIAENEALTEDEVMLVVNNRRKASARQKEMIQVLTDAGYEKPTLATDPQLQLRTIYKALIASGKNEDEARATASVACGIEWED